MSKALRMVDPGTTTTTSRQGLGQGLGKGIGQGLGLEPPLQEPPPSLAALTLQPNPTQPYSKSYPQPLNM